MDFLMECFWPRLLKCQLHPSIHPSKFYEHLHPTSYKLYVLILWPNQMSCHQYLQLNLYRLTLSVFAFICCRILQKGWWRCGTSQWVAAQTRLHAKQTVNVMVAVCCHGVLLKRLHMFRGEIFAFPLYLQKQLASQTAVFLLRCGLQKLDISAEGCGPLSGAARLVEHASISLHHAC